MKGTINFYDVNRGFGFLQQEGTSGKKEGNLFFHITDCLDGVEPSKGAQVELDVGESEKGPCAINVSLIERDITEVL